MTAEARAKNIKILIFDVDGVLTDGQLFFIPENGGQPGSDGKRHGLEVKGFTAHDGLGITLARLAALGVRVAPARKSAARCMRCWIVSISPL